MASLQHLQDAICGRDMIDITLETVVSLFSIDLLTLIKWRHDWWRHHNKSRNLCVDYENAIFRRKSEYFRLNIDNFTMDLTIL